MGNIYNQADERMEMFKLNIYSPIFEKNVKAIRCRASTRVKKCL